MIHRQRSWYISGSVAPASTRTWCATCEAEFSVPARPAANADDEARGAASSIRHSRITQRDKSALKALESCIKTGNQDCASELARLASKHPLECAKIAKRLSQHVETSRAFDKALRETLQSDSPRIQEFIKSWIQGANLNTDSENLPNRLSRIYYGYDTHFVNLLKVVDYKNTATRTLICSTLQRVVWQGSSKMFLKDVEEFLQQIAKWRGVRTVRNSNLKYFLHIQDLILQIQTPRITNIENVQNNLKKFEHLAQIIKDTDLEKMTSAWPLHPLLSWLSTSSVFDPGRLRGIIEDDVDRGESSTEQMHRKYCPHIRIANINNALSLFGNEQGMKRIRDGLRGAEFLETRAELNVAARFKKYGATLQPQAGSRKLDLKLTIGKSAVSFEVYRPRQDQELEYGLAAYTKNKMPGKLIDKAEQMQGVRNSEASVVLVVDRTEARTELGDISRPFGSTSSTLTDEANTIPPDLDFENSIYCDSLNADLISAIMLVDLRCDIRSVGMKFCGSLYHTPCPQFPLDPKVESIIRESMFQTVL